MQSLSEHNSIPATGVTLSYRRVEWSDAHFASHHELQGGGTMFQPAKVESM